MAERAKIKVQIDAEKLCKHTLKITSNLKNFPKKYRFTLVDKLVRLTFDIHDNICDANNSFNKDERIYYIQRGISCCRNHPSKEYLKYCENRIVEHLNDLNLSLNPKSQIIPFKNGISFLGFHFYKEDIGFVVKLNNKKKRDYRRKFNKMYKKVKCGSLSFDKLEESYRSWKNHASFCTDKSIFVYYDTRMKALKKLKGGERKRGN